MTGSINRVILVGNLGRDPEVRHTTSGAKIVHLSVATSDSWKDKNGEQVKNWKQKIITWESNNWQQAQPKYVEATPSWLNMEIPEEDRLSDEEIEKLKGGIE